MVHARGGAGALRSSVNDPEAGGEGRPSYRTPWSRAPRNPWWIPPVLGRAPELPPARITLLGSVCLALFFDRYVWN